MPSLSMPAAHARRTLLLGAALAPLLAGAQDRPSDLPPEGEPPKGSPPGGAPSPAMQRTPTSTPERLREQLKLEPAQQPAWARYAQALDAYSRVFYEEKPPAAFASDTGPRQIGRMVDNLQNRLAALEDVEAAARELYASLSLVQKKTADQSLLASVPVFAPGSGASCPDAGGRGPGPDRGNGGPPGRMNRG